MSKFTREDILRYYSILGLEDQEGLICPETIKLDYITDLFELNEFDRKLSYTAKDLSDSYGLLHTIINDGFWYTSKKRRSEAFNASMEIIDELTDFDVEDEDNEEMTIDRKNNLKATIIKGLCSVGDIITFNLYQKNASFNSMYTRIVDKEKEDLDKEKLGIHYDQDPEALKILNYLIVYSKFKSDGSDFEMFDGVGKVSLPNLRRLVKRNIYEEIPLRESDKKEKLEDKKILRLSHYKKNDKKKGE